MAAAIRILRDMGNDVEILRVEQGAVFVRIEAAWYSASSW
jgi:hypothetical protein